MKTHQACQAWQLALIIVLSTFTLVNAQPEAFSGKSCIDFFIPVTVTSTNNIWGRPKFTTNIDIASLTFDFNRK